jgi:hypothetical protein
MPATRMARMIFTLSRGLAAPTLPLFPLTEHLS